MMMFKERVKGFWNTVPCGSRETVFELGSPEFFSEVERARQEREPFINDFARFSQRRGQKILEVGVGLGTDFIRFVRAGAIASGIDLTERGVELVQRRLSLEGLSAKVVVADAESLPFDDGFFDFVYSWGVIHHTEDTARAAREILRVTKPGGTICVMIYNRYSMVALQCWILNALLRGRPWRTLTDVIGHHIESEGTKAYSISEARALFGGRQVKVTPVVTPYDLRISRHWFLPSFIRILVPPALGWFLIVEVTK